MGAEGLQRELLMDLGLDGVDARTCFSARRAACWWLEVHDWDALETDIRTAVQGYEAPEEIDLEAASEALTEVSISGRSGLAVVVSPATRENTAATTRMGGSLEAGERFSLTRRGDEIVLVTEHRVLHRALDRIGDAARGSGPLCEIALMLDPHGDAVGGASSLVLDLVEGQGLDVVHSFWSGPSLDLLVPSEQAVRAVALIDGLVRKLAGSTRL